MTLPDERRDYGEPRFVTVGWLRDRFVAVVWTPRDDGRRIISMRYGHAEEKKLPRANGLIPTMPRISTANGSSGRRFARAAA
jgi:Ribonuclease toxin, BrnT, of type II toxin-antitoxin system